jgi:hypothetical protein
VRSQILTAPYALRADRASTAQIAETAGEVTAIGGVSSEVLNQLYAFGNGDESGPLNADPREGIADVDDDGAWNFVDSDNDGDGIADAVEIANGGNLNLVSPTLSTITPSAILASVPRPLVLGGAFFDAALTASLNGVTIVPTGITPTSATIAPSGVLPVGQVPLYVVRGNGERSTLRTVTASAQPPAGVTVSILRTAQVSLAVKELSTVLLAGDNQYEVDTNGDAAVDQIFPFDLIGNPGGGLPSQIAVTWGPSGEAAGLRCTPVTGGCQVQVLRDANGDLRLQNGPDTTLPGFVHSGSVAKLATASLGFDAAGRPFAGYGVTLDSGYTSYHVIYDRTGDGDFADAHEAVLIETALAAGAVGTAVLDPAGRLAHASSMRTTESTPPELRLACDRNGDGDFTDGGELTTVIVGGLNSVSDEPPCGGVAFDPSGRLAAVFGTGLNSPVTGRIARDLNGDGDFADPGEVRLDLAHADDCGIARGASLGVSFNSTLFVDRNDDGDFTDANEAVFITGGSAGRNATVASNPAGHLFAGGSLSPTQIFVDPF